MSYFLCLCIVHIVYAVTDTRSNTGLTDFPTDVNADVTKLMLTTNAITHVPPGAIQNLPVLNYLGIAANLFTAFPNLTAVADSLENLYAYDNEIAVVDGTLLEALHKLKKLSLQSNNLVSFPTLTSGACHSLTYLNLAENPLATTPSFMHYTALSDLWLHTTDITDFPAIGDAILLISTVRLEKTLITEVPSEFLSGMTSLVALKLTSSSVSSIPSPCGVDMSSLTVLAKSTDIPVCECRHVWLKVAVGEGADIQVDDADCSGYMWSTSTVQQLLDACWVPPASKSITLVKTHMTIFNHNAQY